MQVTYIKNKSIKQITQVIGDEMENLWTHAKAIPL